MPAPNLGLVGAGRLEGMQKALQDLVAERQTAQKLEEARVAAEFQRQMEIRKVTGTEQSTAANQQLAQAVHALAEKKFGYDQSVTERELPGQINLRSAQTSDLQGRPFESAQDRALRRAIADQQGQQDMAEIAARFGNDQTMAGIDHKNRMAEIYARADAEQKASGKAGGGQQNAMQLGTIASALDYLQTGAGKEGAIGAKNWSSLFGYLDKPFAGTKEADYARNAETMISFLTLSNIENLARLTPMSDPDRIFLMNATTTLDRALREGTWDKEIARVRKALEPSFKHLGIPLGGGGGGGEEWERGPDGKLRRKK